MIPIVGASVVATTPIFEDSTSKLIKQEDSTFCASRRRRLIMRYGQTKEKTMQCHESYDPSNIQDDDKESLQSQDHDLGQGTRRHQTELNDRESLPTTSMARRAAVTTTTSWCPSNFVGSEFATAHNFQCTGRNAMQRNVAQGSFFLNNLSDDMVLQIIDEVLVLLDEDDGWSES